MNILYILVLLWAIIYVYSAYDVVVEIEKIIKGQRSFSVIFFLLFFLFIFIFSSYLLISSWVAGYK